MRLLLFTPESMYPREAEALNALFEAGLSFLHLRKPNATRQEVSELLFAIEARFHPRIILHDHYDLRHQFAVWGIHANSRHLPLSEEEQQAVVSGGAHSLDELQQTSNEYAYTLLSPIFQSISKVDYPAAFSEEELAQAKADGIINRRVIALGGITLERLKEVNAMGFGGVAVLGALWQEWLHEDTLEPLLARYEALQTRCRELTKIPRLHFITPPHEQQVDALHDLVNSLVNNRVPLVQIRHKTMAPALLHPLCRKLLTTCHRANGQLIVNDNPHLAQSVGADGVHLGKQDMPVREARRLLGRGYLIGGTANTYEDIVRLAQDGVDYIGLGPFRFTTTKDGLSPIIGIEGYKALLARVRSEGIHIPILLIGGITPQDLPQLMQCGPHGVAMSSGLLGATMCETVGRIETITKALYAL